MAIFQTEGIVTHGRTVGRRLGFPTINLPCPENGPRDGVYVARVRFASGEEYPAVLSQGVPPTYPDAPCRVEAHLLSDCGERYGQTARVFYLAFLRPQEKFPSPEALSAAIGEDVRRARAWFAAESAE